MTSDNPTYAAVVGALTVFAGFMWMVAASYVAIGRGRKPMAWRWLALLFGPFAILALIVLRRKVEAPTTAGGNVVTRTTRE